MNLSNYFPYQNKHILYAVLNWGLGHATRSVPVIQYLLDQQNTISLASDGASLKLLKSEFPNLISIQLPSYQVTYKYESMMLNMVSQLPKFFRTYLNEKRKTAQLQNLESYDLIISDHRYGVYNKHAQQNIFIAHQLNIMGKNLLAHPLASKLNKYLINKFDQCYIPDLEGASSLAGKLSSPKGIDNYSFIGPLSRFSKQPVNAEYDALIILSGPEPARSNFEKKIIAQVKGSPFRYFLVRGVFYNIDNIPSLANLEVASKLYGSELKRLFSKSELVICRAGFSSIMDLYNMNKNALLIPTPGQTEQLYLAKHLKNNSLFKFYEEADFNLNKALTDYYELK